MEWKPMVYKGVDYSDRFLVSECGDIFSLISGKVLKQHLNRESGYYALCVGLGSRKRKKTIRPHTAVASTFVDGYADGLVVNHKDGNKTNNHFSNLEWVTNQENVVHAVNLGLHPTATKVRCVNTGDIFRSTHEASKWCGLKCQSGIVRHLAKTQAYAGRHPVTKEKLTWEYV